MLVGAKLKFVNDATLNDLACGLNTAQGQTGLKNNHHF
jgi:hypothetical protein